MTPWQEVKVWHVDTEELASPAQTVMTLLKLRAGQDTGRYVLCDPKSYPEAVSLYDEPGVNDIDWTGIDP